MATMVLTVNADCNDIVLILEMSRYAMQVHGYYLSNVRQSDWDVSCSTDNTDQVSVDLCLANS